VSVLGQRLLPKSERAQVLRTVRRVLRATLLGERVLGIVFVNDLEIRALNRAWRRIDAATDVLSFCAQEGEPVPGDEDAIGDLVVSVDTCRRQARALGHDLAMEAAVLVAHGLCHLGGLDHERSAESARIQAACEQTLLGAAGLDPAAALSFRVNPSA
jgi:probable rRNA maturation factor